MGTKHAHGGAPTRELAEQVNPSVDLGRTRRLLNPTVATLNAAVLAQTHGDLETRVAKSRAYNGTNGGRHGGTLDGTCRPAARALRAEPHAWPRALAPRAYHSTSFQISGCRATE